jgi:hypothetical protein
MDNLLTISFITLSVILAAYFVVMFSTKKGQLQSLKLITGADAAAEIGQLSPTKFKTKFGQTVGQTLKVYQCSDSTGNYFILETTHKNFGGITRYYTKLTPDSLETLTQLTHTKAVPVNPASFPTLM